LLTCAVAVESPAGKILKVYTGDLKRHNNPHEKTELLIGGYQAGTEKGERLQSLHDKGKSSQEGWASDYNGGGATESWRGRAGPGSIDGGVLERGDIGISRVWAAALVDNKHSC